MGGRAIVLVAEEEEEQANEQTEERIVFYKYHREGEGYEGEGRSRIKM